MKASRSSSVYLGAGVYEDTAPPYSERRYTCVCCHKLCAAIVNDMCPECWRSRGAPKLQEWLEREHGFNFKSDKGS